MLKTRLHTVLMKSCTNLIFQMECLFNLSNWCSSSFVFLKVEDEALSSLQALMLSSELSSIASRLARVVYGEFSLFMEGEALKDMSKTPIGRHPNIELVRVKHNSPRCLVETVGRGPTASKVLKAFDRARQYVCFYKKWKWKWNDMIFSCGHEVNWVSDIVIIGVVNVVFGRERAEKQEPYIDHVLTLLEEFHKSVFDTFVDVGACSVIFSNDSL